MTDKNMENQLSTVGGEVLARVHSSTTPALKLLILKRVVMNETGTYGVLIEEGKFPFCLTLERPWLDNKSSVSCIPKGEYTIKKVVKPIHGECWEVMNVPNRTAILFHKGNFITDSEGCILVGEQFEDALSPKADKVVTSVQASGKAYSEFIIRLKGQDTAKLVILEV